MFKVLVVENDNDLNRTVCLFLNQRGYEAEGCLCKTALTEICQCGFLTSEFRRSHTNFFFELPHKMS